jgi:hypothetical protein
MPTIRRTLRKLVTLTALALLLAATGGAGQPARAGGPVVPDVSGSWSWNEHIIVKLPGDLGALIFGVAPEGPVMHLTCDAWGILLIQRDGASFTGSTDQNASCVTNGGQAATTIPFPPFFDVTGTIVGRAVHFESGDLGQGISCSYHGSLGVADGVATSLNATGGCDVPIPVHPNMDKSVSFDAVRL